MTALLRTPQGQMRLRQTQALALYEAGTEGGLFGPIGVGEGKTLITLLVAWVLAAKRPVLVLPASLIKKTEREQKELAKHWLIPNHIRIVSYEALGRVQMASFLAEYKPDLLIFDECHKLKNKRAAVTRRIARHMQEHPDTKVIALSGTIMKKSLLDFGHILRWCLKDKAPVPSTQAELEQWALAIDEKVNDFVRFDPGALTVFSGGNDDLNAVREGFRQRLVETPGVVSTIGKGERVDATLIIRALRYDVAPETDQHFRKLRQEMQTPDGWQLSEAVDVWRHAKELALGMYYRWNPRPPEEWRRARRDWGAFVRDVLSRSRTLDSELQVVQACDAGQLENDYLEQWRYERDLPRENGRPFTPNVEAVWCDDSALAACLEWMREPGLVWTEHTLFAERLAKVSGCKYFGSKGLAADGTFIDDAPNDKSIIVSLDANREGRNLQKKWNRNLLTSCQEGADVLEQVIGRTHRSETPFDEVYFDILLGCKEHAKAWRRAYAGAGAIQATTGAASKLLIATIDWPSDDEIANYSGYRWERTQNTKDD